MHNDFEIFRTRIYNVQNIDMTDRETPREREIFVIGCIRHCVHTTYSIHICYVLMHSTGLFVWLLSSDTMSTIVDHF